MDDFAEWEAEIPWTPLQLPGVRFYWSPPDEPVAWPGVTWQWNDEEG